MRRISDDEFTSLARAGKIDTHATRKAWMSNPAVEEEKYDHPLVEQGRSLEKLVGSLRESLVIQNNTIIRLISSMVAATTGKRKSWKLKIKRDGSGFMESVDIVPDDSER